VYFLLGLLACLLILSYQLTSATGGLRAAAKIHNKMFTSLLNAPLSYFDTTPSGRLLNMFTADIKLIDESLISQLSGSMSLLFMMLAVLGTIIAAVPFVVAAVVPLFVFLWMDSAHLPEYCPRIETIRQCDSLADFQPLSRDSEWALFDQGLSV